MMRTTAALAACLLTSPAWAQQPAVDHLSQAGLLTKAQQLEVQAAQSGSATQKLAEYPNHFTMISLRKQSGAAEVHQKYADVFFVVRGRATLVTGGTVVNLTTASPGDIRGTSIEGGAQITLNKGDIVHIPANVPHQLLLAAHKEFVYFVVKVQEQ